MHPRQLLREEKPSTSEVLDVTAALLSQANPADALVWEVRRKHLLLVSPDFDVEEELADFTACLWIHWMTR